MRLTPNHYVAASLDQLHLVVHVLLRNMLVNSPFALPIQKVPQKVPQDANPASAADVLGAYYPKAVKCTLSRLTSRGPPARLTQK